MRELRAMRWALDERETEQRRANAKRSGKTQVRRR